MESGKCPISGGHMYNLPIHAMLGLDGSIMMHYGIGTNMHGAAILVTWERAWAILEEWGRTQGIWGTPETWAVREIWGMGAIIIWEI